MKKLVALCLLLLFVLPCFSGDDSMPAYVIFFLGGSVNPPDMNTYGTGCITDIKPFPIYGGSQVLPLFGQVKVTDATVQELKDAYMVPWHKALDWEITGSNLTTDVHQIRAFVQPEFVSASGLNRITRDQVESFLNEWNATVDSIAIGEVNFTAGIFNAIISNGFWGRNVSMFTWSEIDWYTSINKTHRVKVDYSGYTINVNEYAGILTSRGCEVVQNKPQQKYVIFDCSRDAVHDNFKLDVKSKFDGQYAPYKWRLLQDGIDLLIANEGQIEATKAQLINYLRHRLDD